MNNNHLLLMGLILEAKRTKNYNHWPKCSPPDCQTGCRYGKPFHKLKVKLENNSAKNITVFTDKLAQPDKVLAVLENKAYIDQRYLFTCIDYFGNYHLIDLKELPKEPPP